jgi:hypothetical protein
LSRGAVLSQLPKEAMVVSNQATRHYGVDARALWEEERDKGQTKHWDASSGTHRVDMVYPSLILLILIIN